MGCEINLIVVFKFYFNFKFHLSSFCYFLPAFIETIHVELEIYKNHDIIRHRATLLIRRHNLKAEWNRRCIEVIDHTIQEMESMDGWNAIAAKLERIESEEKDTSHRRRSSIGLTKVEMLIESDDIIQKLTKRITK